MKLLYIANEISEDTKRVFDGIHAKFPEIEFISDNKQTNYDAYVEAHDPDNKYFVIVYCKHSNKPTSSFLDFCALGNSGLVHHAKYVLFYHPEHKSFDKLISQIYEYNCIE